MLDLLIVAFRNFVLRLLNCYKLPSRKKIDLLTRLYFDT